MPAQRIAVRDGVHHAHWLCNSRDGQAVLAGAHASGVRPRCLCIDAGVEMYVARRGASYYLSRLPGTGFLHADDCPSNEAVNIFSAISVYADGTIAAGADTLHLLYKPNGPVQLLPSAVTIDGMLDLLLDLSDLNVLYAREERRWATVRGRLAEAAARVRINGGACVGDDLVVPEAFDRDTYDQHVLPALERRLAEPKEKVVCAPLKTIAATAHGWAVTFKHMPKLQFWAHKSVVADSEARAQGAFVACEADYPALCLAAIKPARHGAMFGISALAVRRVDHNYLPCQSAAEATLANALHQAGTPFMRPLRFDAPIDYPLADYAITDGPTPTAVLAMGAGPCEARERVRRLIFTMLSHAGDPVQVVNAAPDPRPPATTARRPAAALLGGSRQRGSPIGD
jgi:hypothetical protein